MRGPNMLHRREGWFMPKGLTRAAIVAAALELLDEVGLEGITVRALAAKLDVKAPALYWHVRDKAELFDEVATEVWRGIGEELADVAEGTPWDAELRRFCGVLRSALLRHRDGAKAFSGTYLTDPAILAAQESGLQRWADQGFSVRDTARAFSLANGFVVGFCVEEQAVGQADARQQYDLRARAERVGEAEHPLTVEAGVEIFGDRDAQFAALVDLLVVAVGSMRGSTRSA